MAIRTGAEYLAGLRDGREVYLDGKRVDDVTDVATFGSIAHTIAGLYDKAHTDEYRDALTFEGADGARVNAAWFLPHTRADVEWRRAATEVISRESGGLFGRTPQYVALFFLGMLDMIGEFSGHQEQYQRNIRDYIAEVREKDLALSHAFVDVQADAGVEVDDTVVPKVVSRNDEGVTVRGVKTVATFAPHADEILVGVYPRAGLKDHHVLYFAVPIDTPGVRIVARTVNGNGNAFDRPVSAFGDENDAMLVLDDVFVPWERVFSPIEDPRFCAHVFPRISEWAHWDILVRLAVKAEVLTGLFALIPEMIGRAKQPQSVEALGESVRYLTGLRAFIYAAEDRGQVTPGGHFLPDPAIVTAGRAYSVESYRRIIGHLQDITSQGLINVPTLGTFQSPVVGPTIEAMLSTAQVDARDRARITRLAADLVSDSYAGRQTLFELFNALPFAAQRGQLVAMFDTRPYKDLARATAGVGSLPDAQRAVAAATANVLPDYDLLGDAYQSHGGRRAESVA